MRKFCQNQQNAQLCRPKNGSLPLFLPSAAGQNSDTFSVLHTVEQGKSLQGRGNFRGYLPASVLALSVTACAAPHSPFCRYATSSPGAGEVFPQRERPWQRDEVCVDCQGLSLWESCQGRQALTERARTLPFFLLSGRVHKYSGMKFVY